MDIIYVNLSPKMQSTKSVITAEDVAEITGRNQEVVERREKPRFMNLRKTIPAGLSVS